MKKILLALSFCLLPSLASAQCSGIFQASTVCGSVAGGTPKQITLAAFGIPTLASDNVWTGLNTYMQMIVLPAQSANTVLAGPITGSAATPAFRAMVGADLPNPGASSKGGVQSYAAVTNQWINTISTSGVPASTQPGFSNLSGQIDATNQIAAAAIANSKLTNSSTTVNGQTCTLGSTCTVSTTARELMSASRNYYVNCSTGNNANAGTIGSPFADPAYAYALAQKTLDLAGQYTITVTLQANCPTTNWVFEGPLVGAQTANSFVLTATSSSINVTGPGAGGFVIQARQGARISVTGFTCTPAAASGCFLATGQATLFTSFMIFNTNGAATLVYGIGGGTVLAAFQHTIVSGGGSVGIAVVAEDMSYITMNGAWTLTGTPAFGIAFVQADISGLVDAAGFTFSGSGTGTRWIALLNATLFTNGGTCNTYFPGNANGSATLGGQCS